MLFKIELPHTGGLEAEVCILPNLEEPITDDEGQVWMYATILLPSDPTNSYELDFKLIFEDKVYIAGECLRWSWGFGGADGYFYRLKSRRFAGRKWSNITSDAEEWGRGEVQKLVDALEERHAELETIDPCCYHSLSEWKHCPWCGKQLK